MRSVCLTIALNGYEREYADCLATQAAYSRRHGYSFIPITRVPWRMTPGQSAWLKVELMRRLLLADVEHVAFIDADCEVRPHAPGFESEFDGKGSLLLAHGKSGRVNSGVIFVQNDNDAIDFLSMLGRRSDQRVPKDDSTAYENGHFIYYGRDQRFIGYLDHRAWNNNSVFDDQSFIQHYSAGVMRKYRRKHMLVPRRRQLPARIGRLLGNFKKDVTQLSTPDFLTMAGDWFAARHLRGRTTP